MPKAVIFSLYPCPDIKDLFGLITHEFGPFEDIRSTGHAQFDLLEYPFFYRVEKRSMYDMFKKSRTLEQAEKCNTNAYGYEIEFDDSELFEEDEKLPEYIYTPLQNYLWRQAKIIDKSIKLADIRSCKTIAEIVDLMNHKMRLDMTAHKILHSFGIRGYLTTRTVVIIDPTIIQNVREENYYYAEFPLVSPFHKTANCHLEDFFSIAGTLNARKRLKAYKTDENLRERFVKHLQYKFPDFQLADLDAYLDNKFLRLSFNTSSHFNAPLPLPQNWKELRQFVPVPDKDMSVDLIESVNQCEMHGRYLRLLVHPKTGQRIMTKQLTEKVADAIYSEYEAYKIYEAFGVKVPQTNLIENAEGQPVLIMQYLEGPTLANHEYNDQYIFSEDFQTIRDMIEQDWPIDALICNPDTGSFHNQNVILTENGPYRIDMGYALGYLPDGYLKSSDHLYNADFCWNNSIRDFYGMRLLRAASALYGDITNAQIFERLQQAQRDLPKVKKVASSTNYGIIARRLHNALQHFGKLVQIEQQFRENADSITGESSEKRTPEMRPVKKLLP